MKLLTLVEFREVRFTFNCPQILSIINTPFLGRLRSGPGCKRRTTEYFPLQQAQRAQCDCLVLDAAIPVHTHMPFRLEKAG